jgi:hypothetical protein
VPPGLDLPHRLQEIESRACQPVETGDDKGAAVSKGVEGLGQLGPVCACPAHGLLEDRIAALRRELVELGIEGLAGGGNASITDGFPTFIMHAFSARLKALKSLVHRWRAKFRIFARFLSTLLRSKHQKTRESLR